MSSISPNNVIEESWLLFFLTRLFGLRVFPKHRQLWLSYSYAFILTISYYIAFFITVESISRHYESLQNVIYFFAEEKFQGYFNLVIVPAIIFSSILKCSEDFRAYKKLQEIDDVLSYLNLPIDHQIQMRKEVVRLLIYVSIALTINLFTYFSLVTVDSGNVFDIVRFLNSIPIFIEVITICAFDIFVEKIRVRFEQINHVIGNLLGPRKISVILVQSTDINNGSKLRLARRIHLQLHDAASVINEAYGLRLSFIFFVTLISVLNYFLKALNLLENPLASLDLVLYMIWTCFHVGKYFYLATSCRSASTEAKLARGFFFEASLAQGLDGMNEEAKALSQQIINRELQLTVYSVFSIDLPRGLMIFIAVLTYSLLI